MRAGTVINVGTGQFRKRGSFQAGQHAVYDIESTLGSCVGDTIAERIGWRGTFWVQGPVAVLGLIVGLCVVRDGWETDGEDATAS